MTNERTDYLSEARSDARDTAREFLNQIMEALLDHGKTSDDLLNDYGNGDSYHHDSHVDKDYDLNEAAELLGQLHKWEETDSGLWNDMEPCRAVACMAAYTYGNAVYAAWQELVGTINDDDDVQTLNEEYTEALEAEFHDDKTDKPEHTTDEIETAMEKRVREIIDEFYP